MVSLYKDGSLLEDFMLKQQKSFPVIDFFILGQGLSGEAKSSLGGEMADFQVWTEALSIDKVEKIASCVNVNLPSQISLNRDEWLINGTTVWSTNYGAENVCQMKNFSNRNFMLMGDYSWKKGLELCQAFGGRLPTPMDDISNNLLKNVIEHDPMDVQSIYLGIERSSTGWTDAYTGEAITYWPERVLIQGKRASVCMNTKTNTWFELEYPLCLVVCEIPSHRVFLKGLCAASKFSKELWVQQSVTGQMVLREAGNFILQASQQKHEWSLSSSWHKTTRATMKSDHSKSPFGKHMWNVWDEECGHNGDLMPLMLTPCPKDSFTCGDLSCIPLEWTCNGRLDCDDKSDEHCFDRVMIPQQYLFAPPLPNPMSPFTVVCGIEVINYSIFSIKEMALVVDLNIIFQWRDERLKFLYLKDEPVEIPYMIKDIWNPTFDMVSGLGIRADVKEGKKMLTMKRVGSAETDDLSSINGGKAF